MWAVHRNFCCITVGKKAVFSVVHYRVALKVGSHYLAIPRVMIVEVALSRGHVVAFGTTVARRVFAGLSISSQYAPRPFYPSARAFLLHQDR